MAVTVTYSLWTFLWFTLQSNWLTIFFKHNGKLCPILGEPKVLTVGSPTDILNLNEFQQILCQNNHSNETKICAKFLFDIFYSFLVMA